jgi:hypothetical protein
VVPLQQRAWEVEQRMEQHSFAVTGHGLRLAVVDFPRPQVQKQHLAMRLVVTRTQECSAQLLIK